MAKITPADAWDIGYGMAVRGFTANTNPLKGRLRHDWLAGYGAAIADGKWGTYLS